MTLTESSIYISLKRLRTLLFQSQFDMPKEGIYKPKNREPRQAEGKEDEPQHKGIRRAETIAIHKLLSWILQEYQRV